ncbi:MAG: magnesium transporter [Pyrodictiaceae archaeon]
MQRAIVSVEAKDKPGLLAEIISALTESNANVITHLGYIVDSTARLLFIVDTNLDPDELGERISNKIGDGEVKAAPLGPESSDIIASFIEDKPILIAILETYLDPPDILDSILRLNKQKRISLYKLLSNSTLSDIAKLADAETLLEVLESIGIERFAKVLSELEVDEIVDVMQKLPEEVRRRVLQLLSPEMKASVTRLLAYPPETAGGVMTENIPVLRANQTVYDALYALRSGSYDVKDTVFIVDDEGRLVGLVSLDQLLYEVLTTQLERIMIKPRITVNPWMDREEVAKLMLRYNVTRLPVVSDEGKLLGVITIEDIANVLVEEAAEDIALLGATEKPRERYIRASVTDLVKSRITWLLLIYVIESVTANILAAYSSLIEKVAVIAAFIPLVMDTGGNVGSQATATIIRALALGEISEHSRRDVIITLAKELATSMLIGLIMSIIGFGFSYVISRSLSVAIAVSLTLFTVIVFADVVGSLLPIVARRLGYDPAVVSAPLITSVVDITVSAIYMALAALMVMGVSFP